MPQGAARRARRDQIYLLFASCASDAETTTPTKLSQGRLRGATAENIVLLGSGSTNAEPFLLEQNSSPKDGTGVTGITTEFTLDQLSSVKVNPQIRAPIPKTGTVVASLFVPDSGESFDLASYFDYNKEYLSFPLTNVVESLYLCASSTTNFNSSTAQASISASLTWEEQ